MLLFIDVHHRVGGLTAEAAAAVHQEVHVLEAGGVIPVVGGS